MPVKLDLRKQTKLDEEVRQDVTTEDAKKKVAHRQTPARTKKVQGRPKGEPSVTRSLRIREDINSRLIARHDQTKVSFNDLVNEALDAYLD